MEEESALNVIAGSGSGDGEEGEVEVEPLGEGEAVLTITELSKSQRSGNLDAHSFS